ncbi:MAG: hypothetical protein AAFQ74_20845 [Cyanobacteria bacterium J06623_4]
MFVRAERDRTDVIGLRSRSARVALQETLKDRMESVHITESLIGALS